MSGRSRARELFDRFRRDGETMIDRMIEEQVSEELFIDYKRSGNNGDDSKLHADDRANFARAISGFGNSEGGIVVWGIDCRNIPERGDVPDKKYPLKNPKRFVSYLEGCASGCTLPPHDGIKHHAIEMPHLGEGFAVSYIPKSMFSPHLCIIGKHEQKYFVRVGSNFERASHGLLAGMFGKQPSPQIFAMFMVEGRLTPASYAPLITSRPTSTTVVSMTLVIRNSGVSIAKDIFVNFELLPPGLKCEREITPSKPMWTSHESAGGFHMVSTRDFRLAPAAMVHCIKVDLWMVPPFENPLSYEVSLGCTGSQVHRLSALVQPETVSAALDSFLRSNKDSAAGVELAKLVFGTEQAGADYRAAIDS